MKDLLVIVGTACGERGLMAQFRQQLADASIDVHVQTLTGFENTLAEQIREQRPLVKGFLDYEKIIFTDAFDVLFFGTKAEVLAKVPADHIVYAAERICWPEDSRAGKYAGTTPWRYANGGLSAGTSQNFLKWLDDIEHHPLYPSRAEDYNQRLFNDLKFEQSPLMHLDETTELFYCMPGEKQELGFEDSRPVNRVCNTRPNFLHVNNPPNWNHLDNPEFWKHVPFGPGWIGDWREVRWQ